jgi:short-subunit dehydrogenase
VVEKIKHLDVAVMVINAGVGKVGPFLEIEAKDVQDMVRVNTC